MRIVVECFLKKINVFTSMSALVTNIRARIWYQRCSLQSYNFTCPELLIPFILFRAMILFDFKLPVFAFLLSRRAIETTFFILSYSLDVN